MRRAALLVVAIVACERADQGPPPQVLAVDDAAIDVALIDAGDAPRAPLRWRWHAGSTGVYEQSYALDGEGGATPVEYERAVVGIDDVDARGRFHEVGTIVEQGERSRRGAVAGGPGAPPRAVGAREELWVEPTGEERDVRVIAAADLDLTQMRQVELIDITVFPREDVGAGARWRITARQGDAHGTIDVELVRRTGDRAELRAGFAITRERGAWRDVRTGTIDENLDLVGPGSIEHVVGLGVDSDGGRETARYTYTGDLVPRSR